MSLSHITKRWKDQKPGKHLKIPPRSAASSVHLKQWQLEAVKKAKKNYYEQSVIKSICPNLPEIKVKQ